MKKILFSGVKPTGRPHIGNYFGAMKQFVDFQNNGVGGESALPYIMIADYHALNFIQNKEEMAENILGVALDYLAIGIDPEKSIIFKQSDVSAHTELAWIFDSITTMPYLMRAHAFKDAEAKNKEINVGTFNYPMLMASDILLYDTDIVPVGQDQKQHVEITRDTAEKFNRIFGKADKDGNPEQIFKLPESVIVESVAVVPGTDGQKMSKSYGNTIPLFAESEEIKKAVMGIVTDSSGGVPKNVYAIHKLFRSEAELEKLYKENEGKYKALKEALIADIEAFIAPMREKRAELEKNKAFILEVLKNGAKKANEVAGKKLAEIKEKIGVNFTEQKGTIKISKEKNYNIWNPLKQEINNSKSVRPNFHEREIWYCHVGENIGYEQDGKGESFLRPVVIIKKFNNDIFWALPLTSTVKKTKFYHQISIEEKESSIILSQIKLIDAKRLSHKIGNVSKEDFVNVTKKLKDLIP